MPTPQLTTWRRAVTSLALGAISVVAAAGVYTEARRAPDQP